MVILLTYSYSVILMFAKCLLIERKTQNLNAFAKTKSSEKFFHMLVKLIPIGLAKQENNDQK